MFGSTILDSAVGLIVVFLLLSLVVTAVQEGIASVLSLRSKQLYAAIQELLDDTETAQASSLAQTLYDHSLVGSLAKGGNRPSYLPSSTFVIALLDTLVPATPANALFAVPIPNAAAPTPAQPTVLPAAVMLAKLHDAISTLPQKRAQQALLALYQEAQGDLDKFKSLIESWFNNAMDRVSGWYKRQSQYIVLFLAAMIVIGFNIDSVQLGKAFLRDPKLREVMVNKAEGLTADSTLPSGSLSQPGCPVVDDLNLPIGWGDSAAPTVPFPYQIPGWLVTIFAISLGAPFWFDILKGVMNIRGAGKVPKTKRNS